MEQITITAKVQIVATDTDKVLLNKSLFIVMPVIMFQIMYSAHMT